MPEDDIADIQEPTVKAPKGVPGWVKKWGALVSQSYQPDGYTQVIPTGLPTMDMALGTGGVPCGCVVSIYGKEGCGKSTLWQSMVGNVQRMYPERIIVIVDAEERFVGTTAMRNGMSADDELFANNKLIYVQPSVTNGLSYEKIVKMLEELVVAAPDGVFMVIDSLDAMSTSTEMDMEADDGGVKFGGMAKQNSILLKRVAPLLKETNSNLILIQQLRDKVNSQYAGQVDTSGGHAVKHYSSIRMKMTPITPIRKGDEITGYKIEGRIEKNSYFRPFIEFSADLRYDFEEGGLPGGFDFFGAIIDLGVSTGLITKSGASHVFKTLGENKHGRDVARRWLFDNPDKCWELRDAIYNKLGGVE